MKNKEFHKLLKKNSSKSNSGFTLTELLVGLIMSIFVIGALGFGLMTVLRTTQSETSKVAARNETSRALDFISDEVRRASTIENAAPADATFTTASGKTQVLALNIPEVNTDFPSDADDTTPERIVYFLQSNSSTNWEGPLVLYRYGPPLNADGNYTGGSWSEEALIDGIDNTAISADPCSSGETLSPAINTASGFHACINGGNTAQLFLTGGTDTADGGTDTYTADTRVVARARTAPANTTNTFTSYTMSYKTLGAVYNCNPSGTDTWKMRTVFANDTNSTSWIHQNNRQPQPVQVNTSSDLIITTVPVDPGVSDCLSRGAEAATGTEDLSEYETGGSLEDGVTVPFSMKFSGTNYWRTFNGDEVGDNNPSDDPIWVSDDNGNQTIVMLKNGSRIPANLTGFDVDGDSSTSSAADQDSLGEFLATNNYATLVGTGSTAYYEVQNLESDERIMAVEVGHNATGVPGFDVQDSVILLSSDVFAQEHSNP